MENDATLLSALARDDQAFQAFVDKAPFGIYRSSLDGKHLRANPALVALNGYDSEAEMLAAVRDLAQEWYVEPGRRATFTALIAEHGQVRDFESEIYRHKTRERIWVSENAWLVRGAAGEPLFYEGTVAEIGARRAAQARLGELAAFQRALIEFVEDSLATGLGESFFQRLLERAVAAVPGAQAGSILRQGEDGRFRFIAAVGFDLMGLKRIALDADELFIDLRRPATQRVTHETRRKVEDERLAVLERAGRVRELKSTLATPIHLGGDAVAYLSLNNLTTEDAFSDEAAEMATVFAQQVGGLLRRFALEEALRERQAAQERWAAFRAGLLGFMREALERGLDQSFYQQLLEHAVGTIPGAEAGSILLRGEDGRYHFAALFGYGAEALGAISFAREELLDDTVSGAANVMEEIASQSAKRVTDERYEVLRTAGRLEEIRSFLSLPVRLNGVVEAILNLDAFRAGAFGPEALEMANTLAAQIGILLQRLELERELKQSNAALSALANYDALTGLPNRTLLADRLRLAFAQAQRGGAGVGVLFLDLDGFKLINDSLGHSVGDLLLQQVAARLAGAVREGDTVARLGGDEFTLIASQLARLEDAAYVADKVLSALRAPFEVAGRALHLTASIGISCYPEDGDSVEVLLQHADTAMYHAKARGNRYRFFTVGMNAAVRERLQLEHDLRASLGGEALWLAYQPRVRLATGALAGFEALARWRHPQRGELPPGAFVPLAERAGLIGALFEQLLRAACSQAVRWRQAGLAVRLAFNLSVKQLHDPALVERVREILGESGLEPEALELEIAESAAMTDVARSIRALSSLRELGVQLVLDDFGTAYSSLGHLKRLPLNGLKIDRSFVRGLGSASGEADSAVVGAIVALGKSLGYQLIAEGVESEAQLRLLQQFGCHEAQGFLFSKPMKASETLGWASSLLAL